MRCPCSVRWLVSSVVLLAVANGCGSPTQPTPQPSAPPIDTLAIAGDPLFQVPNESRQLTATLTRAAGAPLDVTASAAWFSSNTSVVSVSPGGSIMSTGPGAADVSATFEGTGAAIRVVVAATTDCLPYPPGELSIEAAPAPDGGTRWVVVSPYLGGFQLHLSMATQADAQRVVLLMQRYRFQCFVGRQTVRVDRQAYILDYWQDPTGVQTDLGNEDCEPYAPGSLVMADRGAQGWALSDGGRDVVLLDTQADALRLLFVARQYTSRCFIGRGNGRPDPARYIVGYWR